MRDDKQWFFHRDSMVAYAVFGGVCLVSPESRISPFTERAHVTWDDFRRHVDANGWGLGVMAAGEEWLPTYQASGMRFLYIGDEAVVDPRTVSRYEGGKMKGLRQAVNRVARYGYTVRFLDPARLSPADAARLVELMAKSRRGDQERGFSAKSLEAGCSFARDTGPAAHLGRGSRRHAGGHVPVRDPAPAIREPLVGSSPAPGPAERPNGGSSTSRSARPSPTSRKGARRG